MDDPRRCTGVVIDSVALERAGNYTATPVEEAIQWVVEAQNDQGEVDQP